MSSISSEIIRVVNIAISLHVLYLTGSKKGFLLLERDYCKENDTFSAGF